MIYEAIVKELEDGTSVMDIHRMTGAARSMIYNIKEDIIMNKFSYWDKANYEKNIIISKREFCNASNQNSLDVVLF